MSVMAEQIKTPSGVECTALVWYFELPVFHPRPGAMIRSIPVKLPWRMRLELWVEFKLYEWAAEWKQPNGLI